MRGVFPERGGGGAPSPFSALRDESPAGFHLDVQASLHGAHLHVLVQVSVHVALRRSQLHLPSGRDSPSKTDHGAASAAAVLLSPKVLKPKLTYRNYRSQNINSKRPKTLKKKPDLNLVDGLLVFLLSRLEEALGVVNHLLQAVLLIDARTNDSLHTHTLHDRSRECFRAIPTSPGGWMGSGGRAQPGKSSQRSSVSSVSSQAKLSQSSSNSHSLLRTHTHTHVRTT